MTSERRKIIIGITGASGSIYARRLLDVLDQVGCDVHAIFSQPGKQVYTEELKVQKFTAETILNRQSDHLTLHSNNDLFCTLASGSNCADAMVICPCSTHSLSSIAAGLTDSLLLRCAYVSLKERRPLILASREAPLTSIDLENMLKITQAGGIICPASPGFYANPQSIDDLVDFVVARLLDLLHIPHPLNTRWKSPNT